MKFTKILYLATLIFLATYAKENPPILDKKLGKYDNTIKYKEHMKYEQILKNKKNEELKNKLQSKDSSDDLDVGFGVKLDEETKKIDGFKIDIDKKFEGIN